MGVSLNWSQIRDHGYVKGWPKVRNPVWTSLKTSKTKALVNCPQGTYTRGTLNWLTQLTKGLCIKATVSILLGGPDTPDVCSHVGVPWRVVGMMSPSAVSLYAWALDWSCYTIKSSLFRVLWTDSEVFPLSQSAPAWHSWVHLRRMVVNPWSFYSRAEIQEGNIFLEFRKLTRTAPQVWWHLLPVGVQSSASWPDQGIDNKSC